MIDPHAFEFHPGNYLVQQHPAFKQSGASASAKLRRSQHWHSICLSSEGATKFQYSAFLTELTELKESQHAERISKAVTQQEQK